MVRGQRRGSLHRKLEPSRRDTRKHFFTKRVVKPWNRLPAEAVDVPHQSVLKRHLDTALRSIL